MPSILRFFDSVGVDAYGFKPCYKWNAFNTDYIWVDNEEAYYRFKPCYKWNAFNTLDFNKNIDFMAS